MLRRGTVIYIMLAVLLVATAAMAAVVYPPNPCPRANAQAVWANGKVHWAGGTFTATVFDGVGKEYSYAHTAGYSIYNPTTNTWTSSKWDDPTSPRGLELLLDENGASDGKIVRDDGTYPGTSQAFAYDYDNDGYDEIFIHAGYPSFNGNGGFFRFDPNNGAKWDRVGRQPAKDALSTSQYKGVAARYGSKVYCVGGSMWGDQSGAAFSIYNFTTNSWSDQANAPFSTTWSVGAFVGSNLYVLGGNVSVDNGTTTQLDNIWCYNAGATTPSWTKLSTRLLKGVTKPAVAVYNNKIYILGGQDSTLVNQKDIQVFDPALNTVTKLGDLPVAMSRQGGCIAQAPSPLAGTLFVGGGEQVNATTGVISLTNLWWKADLTKTLAFTPIAADPAYFPYEDWDVGGTDFTGRVVDPAGNPIPGAIVAVKNGTHATADAQFYFTADANGEFKAFIKPGGPWYAAAWNEGYTPSDDYNVTPVNGDPVVQDITISRAAGENVAQTYSELYSFSSDQSTNGNVADNNMDSVWESDPASGPGAEIQESFYIEFPGGSSDEAITDISGVTIYWNEKAPADYSVAWSDQPAMYDENWTDVYTATNATGGVNVGPWYRMDLADPIKFDAVTIRTLRVTVTKLKSDKDTFAIREIKVHSASKFLSPLLTGIVKDEAGNPIEGALVHFGPGTGPDEIFSRDSSKQLLTGADGKFVIDCGSFGSGDFALTADAFGFKNQDKTVTLSGDGSFLAPVEFVLPAKTETSIVPNWNCEELDGNGAPVGYSPYWEGGYDASKGTTVTAYEGSIKMTHTGNVGFDGGVITDFIPVKDDGSIAYNIWFSTKWLSGADRGGNSPCYYVKWYDADQNQVDGCGWWYHNDNNMYSPDENGWWKTNAQDIAYRLLPPAGAKYLRIILSRNGGGAAEVLYDNIIVEKVNLVEVATAVTGTVKDESGNPIAGALVHVGPSEPADPWHHDNYKQVFTDANGNYSIDWAGDGTYPVTADAFGYANSDKFVTVSSDVSTEPVNFVLKAKSETSVCPNWDCSTATGYAPYWEGDATDKGTTVTAYQGSIKMTHTPLNGKNPGFDGGVITDFIPVKDDGTVGYNITFSTKWLSGDDRGANSPCYYLKWYGEDQSFFGESFWYPNFENNTDANGWWKVAAQDVAYRVVPPAGAKYLRIILSRNGSGAAEILYDNIIVEEATVGSVEPPAVVPCENIADIKNLSDGTPVTVSGKQLTAIPGSGKLADTGYIEETNRSSGIRLDFTSFLGGGNSITLGVGSAVNVEGTVTTINGEKAVDVTAFASVDNNSVFLKPVAALGMNNRFANAPLATGLYVKLWGKVLDVQSDYFTMTDGSETPVVVYSGDLAKPGIDDVVRVKGILSKDVDGTTCLIMNPEQVEWVDASAATQPLPIQSYHSRGLKPLTDWLVIGPFQKSGVDTAAGLMSNDFISQATGGTKTQANIRPTDGMAIGSLTWSKFFFNDASFELSKTFGTVNLGAAYLATYVWSPVSQTVDLTAGTDELMDIWVNGVLAGSRVNGWYMAPTVGGDCYQGVQLNAGYNCILVKVATTGSGFMGGLELIEHGTYPGHPGDGSGWSVPVEGLGYSFAP